MCLQVYVLNKIMAELGMLFFFFFFPLQPNQRWILPHFKVLETSSMVLIGNIYIFSIYQLEFTVVQRFVCFF